MNLHDRDNFRRGLKKGIAEGITQGITQGSHQKAIETAKNMLNDKLDIQTILKYTGLSIEEIQALEK